MSIPSTKISPQPLHPELGVPTKSEPKPRKYKAGIILVGDVKQPDGSNKLYTLAPWVEGNFSDDKKKSYFIAKGTVDDHELKQGNDGVFKAALREFAEETGIYLGNISDDKRPPNQQQVLWDPYNKAGDPLQPSPSRSNDAFYAHRGVKVERWWEMGEPIFEGFVPSHRGNPAHHTMFVVKVDGIEKLAAHLKHKENGQSSTFTPIDQPEAVTSSGKDIASEKQQRHELPSFEALLDTLRTGRWSWGDKPEFKGRLFGEHFSEVEKGFLTQKRLEKLRSDIANPSESGSDHIAELTQQAMHDLESIKTGEIKITDPKEFEEIYRNSKVQDIFKDDLKRIRKHMEHMGLISDTLGLKLDTKHHPLQFYQEGADIIPYDQWLGRMITFAEEHRADGQPCTYHTAQFNRLVDDRQVGRIYYGQHHSIADMAYHTGVAMDKASQSNGSWKSATAIEDPAAMKTKLDSLSQEVDNYRAKPRAARLVEPMERGVS